MVPVPLTMVRYSLSSEVTCKLRLRRLPKTYEIIPVYWQHISPVKLNLNTWLQYISLPGGVGSPEIEIWDLEKQNWKDLRPRRRPKCSLSALMLIRHAQEGWWREDGELFTKSQGSSLENKKHLPNKHRRGGLNLIVERKFKTSRVTLHAQTNFEIRTIFAHSIQEWGTIQDYFHIFGL